jgi:hypothetical protein
MGNGFARLSGASQQRVENIAGAIGDGFRNAAARDEMISELSQDSNHLRSLGFYGRTDEDD